MASLTAPILTHASVCAAAARARQQPATTSRVARADPIRRTTFLGRGAGQLSPLGRKVRARPPTDPLDERARASGWGDDTARSAGRSLAVSPRRRRARRPRRRSIRRRYFSREPLWHPIAFSRRVVSSRASRARGPSAPPTPVAHDVRLTSSISLHLSLSRAGGRSRPRRPGRRGVQPDGRDGSQPRASRGSLPPRRARERAPEARPP